MKLNNRGFAISSVMYIILVLAVIIISLTLALLSGRKLVLDKLKVEVYDDIYDNVSKPINRISMLKTGSEFNDIYFKNIMRNNTSITSMEFYSNGRLPDGYTEETLTSLPSEDVSTDGYTRAYYDSNKIYVYSPRQIMANKNSSDMFYGYRLGFEIDGEYVFPNWYLNELLVGDLDTSYVNNMGWMFYENEKLKELDLSNFNTRKVTKMTSMFSRMENIASINLSSFNTRNVTEMNNMFGSLDTFNTALTSLDLSSFDTRNVTNMADMFSDLQGITSLDLSHFNTSKVTNIKYMFFGCLKLTSLNVSGWDTSKVTSMSGTFGYTGLTSLDLSSFDTSKVTSTGQMFQNSQNLATVKVGPKWTLSSDLLDGTIATDYTRE